MARMSDRVNAFGPSVFVEINALARQHGAVNLSQGAPDFDGQPDVIRAAIEALQSGTTAQYAHSPGHPPLRQAIAEHARLHYGQAVDAETEVLVVAGAALGMLFAALGLVNPGDEVIVFEPFFDTYVPNVLMAGGVPRYVPLRPPGWTFDPDELAAAFNERTRALILNTPHNPTGRVLSREELAAIAELCQRWDVTAIVDEVYEHLLYDGARHVRLATLPGMHERTLTISSLGKTFSLTGWKIGWCIGPSALVEGVRRVHQYSMFAVAHPLQAAAAVALGLPAPYYAELRAQFQAKRDFLLGALHEAGLKTTLPQGGYYVMADFRDVFDGDDLAFARHMASEVGVACIPPTAFFSAPHQHLAKTYARFTFCKKEETLRAAAERLKRLAGGDK